MRQLWLDFQRGLRGDSSIWLASIHFHVAIRRTNMGEHILWLLVFFSPNVQALCSTSTSNQLPRREAQTCQQSDFSSRIIISAQQEDMHGQVFHSIHSCIHASICQSIYPSIHLASQVVSQSIYLANRYALYKRLGVLIQVGGLIHHSLKANLGTKGIHLSPNT